jgi:hypothetical protein
VTEDDPNPGERDVVRRAICVHGVRRLDDITPWEERNDRTDQRLGAERIEPDAPNDPIDPIENAEPIDPIDRNEPTEPIDSAEPFNTIDRNASCDHSDHRDCLSHAAHHG